MNQRIRGFEPVKGYCHIQLPERKTSWSAGYDLATAKDIELLPQQVTLIPTGIKAYMPADEYLGIHIRSSVAIKQKLSLINGQGIIDADYYNNPDNEGHIMVAVFNHNCESVYLSEGTRIAQGIFSKYLKVDHELETNDIRTGGMGSTGT